MKLDGILKFPLFGLWVTANYSNVEFDEYKQIVCFAIGLLEICYNMLFWLTFTMDFCLLDCLLFGSWTIHETFVSVQMNI